MQSNASASDKEKTKGIKSAAASAERKEKNSHFNRLKTQSQIR